MYSAETVAEHFLERLNKYSIPEKVTYYSSTTKILYINKPFRDSRQFLGLPTLTEYPTKGCDWTSFERSYATICVPAILHINQTLWSRKSTSQVQLAMYCAIPLLETKCSYLETMNKKGTFGQGLSPGYKWEIICPSTSDTTRSKWYSWASGGIATFCHSL